MLLGVEYNQTLRYSKEQNAMVERANKEVLRHLRNMLYDKRILTTWSDCLPLIQRIMMNEPIEHLGVSPAQLVFGNMINLDRGIMLQRTPEDDPKRKIALSEWTDRMLRNQAVLLELAQKNQLIKDQKHMTRFDPTRLTVYPDNSYVLVEYFDGPMGKRAPTKLHPLLKGPYRVINHNDRDEYVLQNLVTDKLEKFHLTLLRPFRYSETHVNPREVALRDTNEFVVERIVDHRGDMIHMSDMEYLVKWLGYDDSENRWLPHAELRDNSVLHEYLRNSNLRHLIPRKHR